MQANTSTIEKKLFADHYLREAKSETATLHVIDEARAVTSAESSYLKVVSDFLGGFSVVEVSGINNLPFDEPPVHQLVREKLGNLNIPVYTKSASVPEIITESWQQIYNANLSEKSYLELLNLASKEDGWRGEGSKALLPDSFTIFLDFWNRVKEFASFPEFSLTPMGNLQAEWFKNNSHFVEIEFLPNKRALFGIFDGKTIIEGEESLAELLDSITSSNKSKNRFTWSCDA